MNLEPQISERLGKPNLFRLHIMIISRNRILDHIRIILIMPAVWLTYQLLANGSVALTPLLPHTKSFWQIWRYLSEILICLGCMISCYFIVPKSIRKVSLISVLLFYVLNFLQYYFIPWWEMEVERFRLLSSSIYYGTAFIVYIVLAIIYDKQRLKQHS